MVQLATKVTLQRKEEVAIPLSNLAVQLQWTANVDLDLMVFYRMKEGQTGGILSDRYPNGNQGKIGEFPYITLDEDAGVGAVGGDNSENVTISQIDPSIEEYYIIALNYTDASNEIQSAFASYDGGVTVRSNEGGEETSVGIPLDTSESGHVVLIGRIDNTSGTPRLVNENRVMSLGQFAQQIPGAHLVTS